MNDEAPYTSHVPRKNYGPSVHAGPALEVLDTNAFYKCFCKATYKIYRNVKNITSQNLNSAPILTAENL